MPRPLRPRTCAALPRLWSVAADPTRASDVAMHGFHGEGRQTHGDVLSALGARRRVLHPLPFVRDDGLAGIDVGDAVARDDAQRAAQDDGVFVELRSLSRLDPAARTVHPR